MCPGCGLHESILAQPDLYRFTFAERHCDVCSASDAYARILGDRDAKHDQTHPHQMPGSRRPGDGRHVALRPMTPDEIARADTAAADGEPMRGRRRRRMTSKSD